MAKGKTRAAARKLPTTQRPAAADPGELDETGATAPVKLAHQSAPAGRSPVAEFDGDEGSWDEPDYLVHGTGCLYGHDPGEELIEPKLGKVPSRRTTRIGIGLLIWILLGIVFFSNLLWLSLILIGGVTWILLSTLVQFRSGHRGHCMRTRAWRYAWGGLVPMPRVDPTREAE